MTRSESIGTIAAALAKAQKSIECAATKDAKNPHFNAKYADLASIVDACREPLAANEIAVLQSPATDGNLVRMTTLLLHSSGEWIESDPLQVQARDAAPQAVGSCLTYLRRYQLAAMVGVAPEDDDAEQAEGRGPVARVAPRPLPQSQGVVMISAVHETATANPNVKKYTIDIAGGPDWPANQGTVATINAKLAMEAARLQKAQVPARVVAKQTNFGWDLVSIEPAPAEVA